MGYFLSKTWVWWLLAALLAGLIAWLLCRFAGRRGAAVAVAAAHDRDRELDEARGLLGRHEARVSELEHELTARVATEKGHTSRIAELEASAGEHDALRREAERVPALTDEIATLRGRLTTSEAAAAERDNLRGRITTLQAAAAERDTFRTRISALESELRECNTAGASQAKRIAELEAQLAEHASASAASVEPPTQAAAETPAQAPAAFAAPAPSAAPADPDVAAGSAALGFRLKLDDLTAVEGIGPKIRDLIHGIGVRTWRELSRTDVAVLQQMLDDAGPRFRVHNPGTWPRQAGLLADAKWAEFKDLTDSLRGGRTV
jgi:predicted flap endonuclease-1-like 5' DNA nuclease